MDHAGSTQRSLQACGGGNVAASSEMWGVCARFTVCACVHAHCYLLLFLACLGSYAAGVVDMTVVLTAGDIGSEVKALHSY